MLAQTTLTLLHKEAKKRVFLQGTVFLFFYFQKQTRKEIEKKSISCFATWGGGKKYTHSFNFLLTCWPTRSRVGILAIRKESPKVYFYYCKFKIKKNSTRESIHNVMVLMQHIIVWPGFELLLKISWLGAKNQKWVFSGMKYSFHSNHFGFFKGNWSYFLFYIS